MLTSAEESSELSGPPQTTLCSLLYLILRRHLIGKLGSDRPPQAPKAEGRRPSPSTEGREVEGSERSLTSRGERERGQWMPCGPSWRRTDRKEEARGLRDNERRGPLQLKDGREDERKRTHGRAHRSQHPPPGSVEKQPVGSSCPRGPPARTSAAAARGLEAEGWGLPRGADPETQGTNNRTVGRRLCQARPPQ